MKRIFPKRFDHQGSQLYNTADTPSIEKIITSENRSIETLMEEADTNSLRQYA